MTLEQKRTLEAWGLARNTPQRVALRARICLLASEGMAKAQGVSPATVARIWDAHGLKPHRVRTFKLSKDKHFVKKLTDVAGLYLNPFPPPTDGDSTAASAIRSCREKNSVASYPTPAPRIGIFNSFFITEQNKSNVPRLEHIQLFNEPFRIPNILY